MATYKQQTNRVTASVLSTDSWSQSAGNKEITAARWQPKPSTQHIKNLLDNLLKNPLEISEEPPEELSKQLSKEPDWSPTSTKEHGPIGTLKASVCFKLNPLPGSYIMPTVCSRPTISVTEQLRSTPWKSLRRDCLKFRSPFVQYMASSCWREIWEAACNARPFSPPSSGDPRNM